jgi:hypothetical protein
VRVVGRWKFNRAFGGIDTKTEAYYP